MPCKESMRVQKKAVSKPANSNVLGDCQNLISEMISSLLIPDRNFLFELIINVHLILT